MEVNVKKLEELTCRQIKDTGRKDSAAWSMKNKMITRDCNVLLPKLDTEAYSSCDLVNGVTAMLNSHEICKYVKEDNDNTCSKESRSIKNIRSLVKKKKEIIKQGKAESAVLLTKCDTQKRKSLLKDNTHKKISKRVRFKIPLAKYRLIKPRKNKDSTKKLIIMLTRCDGIVKK